VSRTAKAAKKYFGDTARQYDAKRERKDMWHREAAVLRGLLETRRPGQSLLDCPVGTGRFLPMWAEFGFIVTGVDISKDMMKLCAGKRQRADTVLKVGDIFRLDASQEAFDIAVAIRIITLIDEPDMVRALRELQRVTRREIIFNTRVPTPAGVRRNAQRLEAIEASLGKGWRIADNLEIHEPSFRMIRLCRD
jgi:ubiquinone/menaquinone biosynthesis C-methylase UbiE